jgi:malonate decarboxylase beta subunit
MTREARLGLNGPQVIEQEAGVAEFDARQRALIWGLTGGAQRTATHLADACVDDDTAAVRAAAIDFFGRGVPPVHRSDRATDFLACLDRVDTARQATAEDVRELYTKGLE